MAVDEDDLIDLLFNLWPVVSEGGVKINHCVLATRVAIEVGTYFGFTWKPLAVDIVMFNDPGFQLFCAHIPVAEWPPEAHSVGCHCEDKLGEKAWPGHVIVETDTHIFDMATAQFDRPERDINVGGPWLMTKPDEPGPWLGRPGNATVALWPRPDITVYQQAKDWKINYRRLAGDLIRILNKKEVNA